VTDLVLTLIGPDRPGLVEAVAEVIAGHGGNWLESRMAHLAGKFAGILRVEVPSAQVAPLSAALAALQARGLRVVTEPSDGNQQPAPDEARTMDLELVGLDRPGSCARFRRSWPAAARTWRSCQPTVRARHVGRDALLRQDAHPPASHADVARLRSGLERMANDLMVEIRLVETALEAKAKPDSAPHSVPESALPRLGSGIRLWSARTFKQATEDICV